MSLLRVNKEVASYIDGITTERDVLKIKVAELKELLKRVMDYNDGFLEHYGMNIEGTLESAIREALGKVIE